jgi:hypothetical protein
MKPKTLEETISSMSNLELSRFYAKIAANPTHRFYDQREEIKEILMRKVGASK